MAAIVHVPTMKPVTVAPLVPEVVHTEGVELVNVTGLPDAPPVAVTVPVPATTTVGAAPKVIVWFALLITTLKFAVNEVVVVSAAFVAVREQVPTVRVVKVNKETEQIAGVLVLNVTAPVPTPPPVELKVEVCPNASADGVATPASGAAVVVILDVSFQLTSATREEP